MAYAQVCDQLPNKRRTEKLIGPERIVVEGWDQIKKVADKSS